ncbi:ferrichrome transport system permease protein FhuB [Streptococcus equi subsp. zooepidemicus MGCS10565]|uniref:Ferrichrome transport system permease protein FhuB n=4 Tax=Streptococcus equi TaxID=1336 RepID=B4U4N4_STREM|nr:ferrichrome transport system permease protein FhuB [Streptococcus equi subsp. zooepidemicus MGCS10565]EQB23170.1 ferrichrome ABC transporter permease [Streptococcus equi subsp. zooepidemicus SzS31A1]KIS04801.1 ferrichrome ABC transporter permease [Streptococcus equi subsp. zooepidemicus Sz12is]KIS16583.1 ferrichrome ABC transporter permease [Streptococcus equi subsp. zooepidemicus Sz4is]QTR96469.1 putative siderophore transport system permease protein YfiZ [Streptococcus equi subsp. zooepide
MGQITKKLKMTAQHHTKPKLTKAAPPWLILTFISLTLVLAIYCSLRFGAVSLSHQELFHILLGKHGLGQKASIIWDIRLPRLILAALVGAALAVSGAIMQGITRNPIAEPGLLGINSGAGLALVIGYAFFPHLHYSIIILLSLLGSLLATLLILSLAYQTRKGYTQMRLILAGAMISMLLSAIGQGITTYCHLANAIIGWQAGGLIGVNWQMVSYVAPLIICGLVLSYLLAYHLTILSLSQEQAKALGQRTFLISLIFIGLVLLLSSAAVAVAGSISFVGLIIPHAITLVTAKDYRWILPLATLLGASFMLWVDFACRNINPPYETPLSALISFIGLPCFLWLVRKGGRF